MSDTSLTGAYDTGRISKIAGEPVTITVSRTPTVGRELEFERWTEHAARVLDDFPGSLGVGILRPGEPGGEWHRLAGREREFGGRDLQPGGLALADRYARLLNLIDQLVEDKDKANELSRLQILLNRTREEVAKEYVTKVEVHADINRVLDRLDRLDAKIDRLVEVRSAVSPGLVRWECMCTVGWPPEVAKSVRFVHYESGAPLPEQCREAWEAGRRWPLPASFRQPRRVVILGMGGSSLGPEVLFATFGNDAGGLELRVLDSTDPAQILSLESSLNLESTLFVVASK